jgi:hypothetical protein
VLAAFYRHKKITPHVPTERGERLSRAIRDVLDAGYVGVFIAIDEMSEYLRRSNFQSDDEDCLLTLSSTLAKAQALPVWTLVAAQAAHSNPRKIIGPDRLREELLEHKAERFRDIVVQRTLELTNRGGDTYFACDGSGFIRRSQVFAGNAVEWRTLQGMLGDLGAPPGAPVIIDRGIATAANLAWLKAQGYRYLVVSRETERRFDADAARSVPTASRSASAA